MKSNALVLTMDALLGLLFLAAAVSLPAQPNASGLFELLILQKENDLLKAWLLQEAFPSETEMIEDFSLVFPDSSGLIEFNGKKIPVGKKAPGGAAISTTAFFFSKSLEKNIVSLTVYD